MNSQTIWEELYEIGLKNNSSLDTTEKKHLFYFIDLIYQIEMGGFIYNQSPTNENDNFYSQYIECLIYFKRKKLANEIANYNKLYQKSLNEWNLNNKVDFENCLKKNSVDNLGKEIDNLLFSLQENYEDIFDWIDKNKSTLI